MNKSLATLGVFLAVLLSGCESEVPETEPPLRPVRHITVADAALTRSHVFSGSSRSSQESKLSFKVAGTVMEIPVREGDRIKPGDVIARLDDTQYRLRVEQSRASLVQAAANARSAEAAYQRTRQLWVDNNTSQNDLDTARGNAEVTRAQESAARKALDLAELELSYTRLQSDGDCAVAEISVQVNENVNSGSPVAKVNCGDELEVEVNVPENLIAGIVPDIAVSIAFDAVAGQRFQGRVKEVGGVVQGGASVFPVVVKVLEPDPQLRSGLAAEVTFAFADGNGGNTYLIPLSAIVKSADGTFVFVAEPQQGKRALVRRKPVQLGELTGDGVQILQGLERGNRVITAGVTVIRDGQSVLLQ